MATYAKLAKKNLEDGPTFSNQLPRNGYNAAYELLKNLRCLRSERRHRKFLPQFLDRFLFPPLSAAGANPVEPLDKQFDFFTYLEPKMPIWFFRCNID